VRSCFIYSSNLREDQEWSPNLSIGYLKGELGFLIMEEEMKKRLGFVGIIVHNRKKNAPSVNKILTEFGDLIVGRMGIPHVKKEYSVIVVIVDASTDELGALTGKLGKLEGVSVKSGLSKDEICNA